MMVIVFGSLSLVGRVATTDCVAFHDGLLRQPVNAYSSLAILAAGLWILRLAAREEGHRRGDLTAFGSAMSMAGVGSVLLHGPAPAWGLWFHDLSGLMVLLVAVALDIGLLLGWTVRMLLPAIAAGLVALALMLAFRPTSTVPIAYVLAPAAAFSDAAVLVGSGRAPVHPGDSARRNVAWLIAFAVIALAGPAYLMGRSGSPLCNPGSLLQWHAVWHLLVAISAAAFAYAAFVFDDEHRARTSGGAART